MREGVKLRAAQTNAGVNDHVPGVNPSMLSFAALAA
jgi:hypothetical protein